MSSDECRGADDARLPRNYRAILTIVRALEPGSHMSAHDVFLRARIAQEKISFTTVHRALSRLHEVGYILKLDIPGEDAAIYEPAASPHAHFRCSDCGSIADIDFALPADALAAIDARHGVQIATGTVTFTGRCPDCIAANERRAAVAVGGLHRYDEAVLADK